MKIIEKCYFFLKFKFIITIAVSINKIPNHCMNNTSSCNKKYAIVTETGNSREATILPKPIPVCGKPEFNKIGGIMVPKSAIKIPQL